MLKTALKLLNYLIYFRLNFLEIEHYKFYDESNLYILEYMTSHILPYDVITYCNN